MVKKKSEENIIEQLETILEGFFVKKLPSLPPKAKELIVKFSPWIAGVILILSLPTLLAALGLSALLMPGYWGYTYHFGYSLAWWVSIASMVLTGIALPGLIKRKMSGWKLMFYSVLVMAVYDLVTFSLGGLIIGTGVSMYILFQIKSYYK